MLDTYFAPWPDDPARYPAHALERHSAHCRALDLPDSTHPMQVRPLLTPEIKERGDRAVEMLKRMIEWSPDEYDHTNKRRVKDDILSAWYRHYAFWGGRGGSKSHDAAEAIVEQASTEYERVVCGREYMNSIRDSSRALLVDKIKASRWANQWNLTDRELRNTVTGSLITFIGLKTNPDSVKSLEGCTIFFGEEAENFSAESIKILIPTIRTPGSRFIWLWNPAHGGPIDKMFRTNPNKPERSFIRCVLCDNNAYFYRSEMPAERRHAFVTMKPAEYRHVWRGALDLNPERQIFSNWSIGRMELPPAAVPRYGLDWGWQDPLAAVELYVIEAEDPQLGRGKIYISAEVYGQYIPANEIPTKLDFAMPMARIHHITADSSEPKSIDDLTQAGIHTIGARKGPGSVRAGISFLQGYDIIVAPNCVHVAKELQEYQWKETKDGKITRDPVDENNHAIDAIRYAVEDYSPSMGDGVDYV